MISNETIDKKNARAFRLVKDDVNRIFMALDSLKRDIAKMKGTDIEVTDQLIGLNQSLQNVRHSTNTALKEATTAKEEATSALKEAEEVAQDAKKYSKPKIIHQTKVVYKNGSKSTSFVASKNGGKVHRTSCPFAKNILPKMRIIFKTKDTALNNGYKECKCLLR
jgi:hypothetical protein